jgi:hypothetical protein
VQNADDRTLFEDAEFASHRNAPTRILSDGRAIGFASLAGFARKIIDTIPGGKKLRSPA